MEAILLSGEKMDTTKANQHGELRRNTHGILTFAGLVVCVVLTLLAGRDIIFGLVMATVYGSGLNIGRQVSMQIAQNVPRENRMPAMIIGPFVAAVIVGIITALILAAIQSAVDVAPAADDNLIASIVKAFFASTAALALACGVVARGWAGIVAD